MYLIGNKKTSLSSEKPSALNVGDLSSKTTVECRRTASGVPVLVNAEAIDLKLLKSDDPIFGMMLGRPASESARQAIIDIPQKKYLISQVLNAFRKFTSFEVIVTSHDLSRNGGKRQNSVGHSKGFATDIILVLPEADKEKRVALDLMNSLAFFAYLRTIAVEIFPAMQAISSSWQSKSIIFGCEYDHVHIEWPWSERALPSQSSFLRIQGVPAGILIGTFYNPQPQYGLPQKRAGDGDGALLIL